MCRRRGTSYASLATMHADDHDPEDTAGGAGGSVWMRLFLRVIVVAMALILFAASARAQGVGVRAGASVDPD